MGHGDHEGGKREDNARGHRPGDCSRRVFAAVFVKLVPKVMALFSAFVTPATPRTPASGRQGVRDAEPNGRFGISTTLDPPVHSDSRDFRRLRP